MLKKCLIALGCVVVVAVLVFVGYCLIIHFRSVDAGRPVKPYSTIIRGNGGDVKESIYVEWDPFNCYFEMEDSEPEIKIVEGEYMQVHNDYEKANGTHYNIYKLYPEEGNNIYVLSNKIHSIRIRVVKEGWIREVKFDG